MLSEPTEDQIEIRDLVRRALADQPVGGGTDEPTEAAARDAWTRLSGDLGIGALLVPEEHGGLGLQLSDMAAVVQECGAALSPAPVLSSALVTDALREAPAGIRDPWLARLAEGEIGAACLAGQDDGWISAPPTVDAAASDNGWSLTGESIPVLDGRVAQVLLVVARGPHGPALFVLDADAQGVTREELRTMDPSRGQTRITFDSAAADLVDDDPASVERLRQHGCVLLAAEQLGGAERCLAAAVAYAQERFQFGRAIGSFQAIKHHCADMLVDVERMRSVLQHAIWAADEGRPELARAASAAQAVCSAAFVSVALTSVQVHGGIGFTWEHDAHRYVRRARTVEAYLGTPAAHRRRLAVIVLDGDVDVATAS